MCIPELTIKPQKNLSVDIKKIFNKNTQFGNICMVFRSYIQNLFKKSSSFVTSLTLDHAIVSTHYIQSVKTLYFAETKDYPIKLVQFSKKKKKKLGKKDSIQFPF